MDGEDSVHVLQCVAEAHTKAEKNGGTEVAQQQIKEGKDARSNIGSMARARAGGCEGEVA